MPLLREFEIENRQIARCRSTRIIPTRRTGTGWRVELGRKVGNYCGIKSLNDRPDVLARQLLLGHSRALIPHAHPHHARHVAKGQI